MGNPYSEVVISGVRASIYRCRGLKIAERPRALCIGMSDKRNNLNIGSGREGQNTAQIAAGSTGLNHNWAFWHSIF